MRTSVYGLLIAINFIVALLSINTYAPVKNYNDSIELTGP